MENLSWGAVAGIVWIAAGVGSFSYVVISAALQIRRIVATRKRTAELRAQLDRE
jgi:hypothetical protein